MKRRPIIILSALTLVAASVASANAAFHSRGGSIPTGFGVLNTAAVPLPAGTLSSLLRRAGADSGTEAHVALRRGDLAYYVVVPPGPLDLICLIVKQSSRSVTTCADRSKLTPSSAIWISHPTGGDYYDLYGIVPDGVSEIGVGMATAHVSNNAFLITHEPASAHTISVRGPMVSSDISIGEPVPRGVVVAPDE